MVIFIIQFLGLGLGTENLRYVIVIFIIQYNSIEEDWYLTPTSTVNEATSSVPSIEMLFVYMYEALERDHLGKKRKRREVKEPSLRKKRDVAVHGNKINPFKINLLRKRE